MTKDLAAGVDDLLAAIAALEAELEELPRDG
jgi:cell division protein FtsB